MVKKRRDQTIEDRKREILRQASSRVSERLDSFGYAKEKFKQRPITLAPVPKSRFENDSRA